MLKTEFENLNNEIKNNEIPNQIESMLKEIIFDNEEINEIKKRETKNNIDINTENMNDETFENSNLLNQFNFIEFTDDDLFNSSYEIFNTTQTQNNSNNNFFFRNNENIKSQTMIMKNTFSIKNNNPFNYYLYDNNRPKSPLSTHKFHMKKIINENKTLNNLNMINSINSNNNNFKFFFPNQILNNQNKNININLQNNMNINSNPIYYRNNINKKTILHRNINNKNFFNKNYYSQNNNQKIRFQTMEIKKTKNLNLETVIYLNELDKYLKIIGFIDYNIFNNIKPKLLHLIKTQTGSKILQNYLEKTTQQIIHLLYNEINDKLNILLLDPYGNYFCLKLFCLLNSNDRISFLSIIAKNITIYSTNKISTYPIQYIVSHLNSKKEMEIIIYHINKNLMKLALDIYGTHVLEKIIISFEKEYLKEIFNFITENLIFLSNHVNGLCLVKKILIIQYENNTYSILKDILIKKSSELIENPFGNYALQIAIHHWNNKDIYDIFKQFLGNLTQFSCMKYASNVIERCIEKNENFLNDYIKEICVEKNSIGNLIKNSFGNYVIQTALKFSKGNNKINLINYIENNINILGEKKLISKWKNIISSYLTDNDVKSNVNNINLNINDNNL